MHACSRQEHHAVSDINNRQTGMSVLPKNQVGRTFLSDQKQLVGWTFLSDKKTIGRLDILVRQKIKTGKNAPKEFFEPVLPKSIR